MHATSWDGKHWICDEAKVIQEFSFGHVEFKGKETKPENDKACLSEAIVPPGTATMSLN